jgi:hypothetical protein
MFLDSLRFDAVKNYRKNSELTERELWDDFEIPELQKLVDRGTTASSLHSTHLSPQPALASLLTGQYPREHELYGPNRTMSKSSKGLPEYFRRDGFHTILFNGHSEYVNDGIMARFDENLMGPVERLIYRVRDLNRSGKPVFVVYEPLDLKPPYFLSKFPPEKPYHEQALTEANKLAEQIGMSQSFIESDVNYLTSEWQIPLAGSANLPLWKFWMERVHHHFNQPVEIFENPVNILGKYYLRTLELIDENLFNTLNTFLDDTEVGQDTGLFITSNAGDGPSERNNRKTFGPRTKPVGDAIKVPGVFVNCHKIKEELGDEIPQLSSHVDISPSILDEFDIDYETTEFSGQSYFDSDADRSVIFAEASNQALSSDEDPSSEENTVPGPCVLTWASLMTDDGQKLYRRGLPVTVDDLQLPVNEFMHRLVAKVFCDWLTEEEVKGRVEQIEEDDSLRLRKNLLNTLENQRDHPEFELYDWKKDFLEEQDELATTDSMGRTINMVKERLNDRFPDPYNFSDEDYEAEDQEEVRFIEPLDAVGYVE